MEEVKMAENSDNQEFIFLEGEEIVKLDEQTYRLLSLSGNRFKNLHLLIQELKPVILDRVQHGELKDKLFGDGVDIECEILKPGKQWRKGKIKVEFTLKFYPDKPEEERESSQPENEGENSGDNNSEYLETDVSPLDDLRQKFNQENP